MKNWNGVWINTGKTMLTPSPEVGRAPYLRKTFSCSSNPRKATVSLCGLGWHELYVNGKKVKETTVATTGKATEIHLEADKSRLESDGADVVHITVSTLTLIILSRILQLQ